MPRTPGSYSLSKDDLLSDLSTSLKKSGIILHSAHKEFLAEFILERLTVQRERLADIVDTLSGMYTELDQDQMATLARLIREHTIDSDGNVRL